MYSVYMLISVYITCSCVIASRDRCLHTHQYVEGTHIYTPVVYFYSIYPSHLYLYAYPYLNFTVYTYILIRIIHIGLAGTELLEAYEKGEIYIDDDDNVVFKEDDEAGEGSGGASSDDDEDGGDGIGSGSEGDWEEVEDSDAEEEEVEIVKKKAKVTKAAAEQEGSEDGEGDGDDWVDMEDDGEEEDEVEGGSDDEEVEQGDEEEEQEDEEDDDEEHEGSIVSAINSTHHMRPRLETKRLLTQADFELLNRLRIAQKERAKDPKYRRKSKLSYTTYDQSSLHSYDTTPTNTSDQDLTNDSGAGTGELRTHFAIDPDTLASSIRTHKMSKIERISHVLQGRKENKFEPNTHPGIYIYDVVQAFCSIYIYVYCTYDVYSIYM